MFVLHCHSCGEKFRIAPENAYKLQNIKCQNCGLFFPDEALKELRAMGENYRKCIDILYQKRHLESGWSITFDQLSYKRPKKLLSFEADNQQDRAESYWCSDEFQAERLYESLKPRK